MFHVKHGGEASRKRLHQPVEDAPLGATGALAHRPAGPRELSGQVGAVNAGAGEVDPPGAGQAPGGDLVDQSVGLRNRADEDSVVDRLTLPRVLHQPFAGDPHVPHSQGADSLLEEGGFSIPYLQQNHPCLGPENRKWDPRQSAPASDVQSTPGCHVEHAGRGERVEDVSGVDLRAIALRDEGE